MLYENVSLTIKTSGFDQNPPAVEERQHIPFPKKSHDISLHTNALDSNLDGNYTPLHPSSQTHNFSTNPTTHFKGDPTSKTLFIYSINY